jgi:exodeoxyribonuclease V alpha subunit
MGDLTPKVFQLSLFDAAAPSDRVDEPAPSSTSLADALHERFSRWALQLGDTEAGASAAAEAARRLSMAQDEGHLCIRVDDPALHTALVGSKLVARAQPGVMPPRLPLVLDRSHRLYFHRGYEDERRFARRLVQMRRAAVPRPLSAALKVRLAALFPSTPGADDQIIIDRQKLAAALALVEPVLVISGGPGTGKTTTLARLLDLVLMQEPGTRIALVAPTGKAAARVTASLATAAASHPLLKGLPPLRARTVHGCLGVHPRTGKTRHHARRPLDVDLLVVDEASMLDLAIARRLLDALPPGARLILLGDKDQLAAVQAGAVLAELAAVGVPTESMATVAALCDVPLAALESDLARDGVAPSTAATSSHCVVRLIRSHRFAQDSGIARLAQCVREGDADGAIALLRVQGPDGDIRWHPQASVDVGTAAPTDTHAHLAQEMRGFLEAMRKLASDPSIAADERRLAACLQTLDAWRLLCAVHDGPSGTRAWNAAASVRVRHAVAVAPDEAASSTQANEAGPWFTGRALLITRNDETLGLVNGDVGVVLPLQAGESMRRAGFVRADGSVLSCPVARLPAVETAFATSVHKAQGSEFDRVTLVLPSPWQRPCTRELLYTALTRARKGLRLVADETSLRLTIAERTTRGGGLASRLAEALDEPSPTEGVPPFIAGA